jgi:hypothetical protein
VQKSEDGLRHFYDRSGGKMNPAAVDLQANQENTTDFGALFRFTARRLVRFGHRGTLMGLRAVQQSD